jgi:hypothetical protein
MLKKAYQNTTFIFWLNNDIKPTCTKRLKFKISDVNKVSKKLES